MLPLSAHSAAHTSSSTAAAMVPRHASLQASVRSSCASLQASVGGLQVSCRGCSSAGLDWGDGVREREQG